MKKIIVLCSILTLQLGFAQQQLTRTQKLATTCKVWGFLKYYHPNVASGRFNWDEQLFAVLPQVEKATTKEQFSIVLENWIVSLGEVKKNPPIKEVDTVKYFYRNLDLAWLDKTTFFSKKLSKNLLFIKQNRWQGKQFYVYLDIHKENNATDGINIQNEIHYSNFKWDNTNLRILTLFKYWNVVEYFYPNKYLANQKWDKSLTDVLPKFMVCNTEKEFHEAITEIVVDLNDSHATYFPKYEGLFRGINFLPANFKFIDNKMVITKILNDSVAKINDIQLGDAIICIDKKSIANIIKENRTKVTGSNEAAYLRDLVLKLRRFFNDTIEIEFLRGSKKIIRKIILYDENTFFKDFKKPTEAYKILKTNIGYVNMGQNLDMVFEEMLPKLKTTRAIIFDVRNYPKSESVNKLAGVINSKPKAYAKSTNPDLSYPGRFFWSKPFLLDATKDNYKGKIIVLVNEETQSWSETIAMYFKTSKNTTVIGSQTAGADGAATSIELMKGINSNITGAGFYYPDGKEVQRVGIIPDIKVKQTIAGIKEGKDEVLERAIKFIETGK